MKKFKVVERKQKLNGVAVELENGKFQVKLEDGTEKTVAPSTFKRWYKITEEDNNVDDIQIKVGKQVTEQPEPKKEEKQPEQPAFKTGDLVTFTQNDQAAFGVVEDVQGEMATVKQLVDKEITEVPVRVEHLTEAYPEDSKDFEKLMGVNDTNWTVDGEGKPVAKKPAKNKPKTEKKKAVSGFNEDQKKWDQESLSEAFGKALEKGITITQYAEEEFKSHGKLYPKHVFTFGIGKFELEVTYIHIWGSTKVELFDGETLLYTAPTGALKPLLTFLGLTEGAQKEFKVTIREMRKLHMGE